MKPPLSRAKVTLVTAVAVVVILLLTVPPAWANGSLEVLVSETYTYLGGSPVEKEFEVPAGYSDEALVVGRKKEGHPERGCTPAPNEDHIHPSCDQLQENEEVRVLLNGEECFELSDQNPLDDQWFSFEDTCPNVQEGSNTLRIEHTGRGRSTGSVHFEMTFILEPLAVQEEPAECQLMDLTPRQGEAPLTVEATQELGVFESIDWGNGTQVAPEITPQDRQGEHTVEYTYTEPGRYQVVAVVNSGGSLIPECANVLVEEEPTFVSGQFQDFIGPVAFGPDTPELEPGKGYFDSTRSVMFNVEYLDDQQGDIVYRFNGQEIDDVTTSLFNSGDFEQLTSEDGRAVTELAEGVTKLIAYRYDQEQARIFQTVDGPDSRWIKPLDQPFEHKYDFALHLHGPASTTDRLVYGREAQTVQYDPSGQATVNLTFDQPGLVGVYPVNPDLRWRTVDQLSYPAAGGEAVDYRFAETGLHYYRIIDQGGQVVAGPAAAPQFTFSPQPGVSYQAQLVYPATSLFVGLYDDMQFQHPDSWLMPVDGRREHDFQFHLDYHRLPDPDLGNDHLRGDIVVDGLTLSYGTTSVAQQFPYGRHDGVQPGVNIAGIPDVSMIAFCQRPGYHEVVYWGGWENESYYLPERAWVFDQDLADDWNEDQRGECIDAARRVNMELARQGLRTDHTFRHHGERSQGYQMVQQQIWSPYNLVGMRPPHLGQILKPGTVLSYYENPEDVLFWGWDLEQGGLADGIGAYELQAHVASLGPAQYVDMTGIHPANEVYVPDFPAQPAAPAEVEPLPEPAQPEQVPPAPPQAPAPTPEPTAPEPTQPEPTPEPTQPEPTPTPTPIVPAPSEEPPL